MPSTKHIFHFLIFLSLFPFYSISQNNISLLDNSQVPFNVKWEKINTKNFTIIFPENIENDAQKVANTLNYIYPFVIKTSHKTRKINIVLQTKLTESNGFATLTPRKIEFFNNPPQNSFAGSINWYDLLSIHEFRHITQYSLCDHGFTKLMHIFFGNMVQSALTNIAVPSWYFEGDAVATETALTNYGRGRLPQFDVEIRTLLLSGTRYKYDKLYFGSYKDWTFIDMPYSFGYQFVSYLRRNYGTEGMNKIIMKTGRKSFWPYSFERAIRKVTHKSLKKNYNLMFNELDSIWKNQLIGINFTKSNIIITPDKKNWTYNKYPKYLDNENIIVFRYGQEDMYKFVKINLATKKEEVLYESYLINEDSPFSISGNKMVWAETHSDKRWGNQSFSVIMSYDFVTKKVKQITKYTRYYSPSLSVDLKQIAVVEYNSDNQCSLLILNADDGTIIKKFENTENEFIQTPSWSADNKNIVFLKTHIKNGKALFMVEIESGSMKYITGYCAENILYPVIAGNFIYYDSPFSGIDNIYAIDIRTKNKYQVISEKFGAFFPSASSDNKTLIYSSITSTGYAINEASINPENCIPIEKINIKDNKLYTKLIEQEQCKNILADIPNNKYEVKNYHGLFKITNLYTWSVLPSTNGGKTNVSLSLKSQNVLNTFATSFTRSFNLNEQTNHTSINLSYAGLYPIFDFGGSIGSRFSSYDTTIINSEKSENSFQNYSWDEKIIYAGINLPLTFSKGSYSTTLSASINASYTHISYLTHSQKFNNNNGVFIPITYELNFSRSSGWLKDIMPKWGQIIQLRYSNTPFKGDYKGEIFSVLGNLYFPGLFKHHSLYFNIDYETQNPDNYRFESMVLFPRGYKYIFEKDFFKSCVNYTLPIAYPDFSLLHTIYFKRIISNLFYDYGIGINYKTNYYRSTGIELIFETYIFKIPVPFMLGARYSYLFDRKNINTNINDVEFIFSISL